MSDREILKAALNKAQGNGFKLDSKRHLIVTNNFTGELSGWETWVYSHDFAKALWKDDDGNNKFQIHDNMFYENEIYYWQHHLMQMVVSDNPIQYLMENMNHVG